MPTLPPAARSRVALGLTAAAALGRFELQQCRDCGTVQYPPREACGKCLSVRLPWTRQDDDGELLAATVLHHSNDLFFRERLPWRLGLVKLACGPTVVAHLHAEVPPAPAKLRVAARLDRAGQAVLVGLPDKENVNMAEDRQLREFACDPKHRKVLVTDGKSGVGQALVKALAAAGAELVWVGYAEPWKRFPGFDELQKLPQVTLVPLDVTDSKNVRELAAEIGAKVDILVSNAEFHRAHGIGNRQGVETARAEMDVNYFGLLRLAQEFGPAMRARRGWPRERGGLGQPALGLCARQLPSARHLLGFEGRRAVARAMPARGDAPRGRTGGECLSRSDRRRVEPAPAAAQARAGRARGRDRKRAARRGRGPLSGRRGAGVARALARQSEGPREGIVVMSALASFVQAFSAGKIRVVDLTQTLSPEFPHISLPPEMGQAWPFRIEEVSRYDERGPAWYWNNFSCGEHTGTHFDAPIHWISGRDLPQNATDSIPPERFIGPACVVDCSRESASDPDFLLTKKKLLAWEKQHGRIPPRAWVLMRTDWSKRADPVAYQNYDETGQHTPGPDVDAVKFLVEERDLLGFGTESIGTDAGQAQHLRPPYPCHYFMHGAGRYGLQCLANLDQLPPTGAVVIAAPLKIRNGSGSPLRVLALISSG